MQTGLEEDDMKAFDPVEFATLARTVPDLASSVVVRSPFGFEKLASSDDDRTVDILITTRDMDREGDIVEPEGVKLDNYLRNPVVLFAHDHTRPPIGKALKLDRNERGIVATTLFADTSVDPTGFAETIYRMVREGFLNAASIGFVPIKYKIVEDGNNAPDEQGYRSFVNPRIHFAEVDLLEYSIVPVPANPNALVAARKSGIDTSPLRDFLADALADWEKWHSGIPLPRDLVAKAFDALQEEHRREWVRFDPDDDEVRAALERVRRYAAANLINRIAEGEVVEVDESTWQQIRRSAGFAVAATASPEDGKLLVGRKSVIEKIREERRMQETKGAISYRRAHPQGTPKAREDAPWDGPAEVAKADIGDLVHMCAWVADKPASDITKADYKLPHHRADGRYTLVWNGVRAAMAALMGARGGVDIPSKDRRGVYEHLARHYREFEREPPEFRHVEEQTLAKKGWTMDENGAVVRVIDEEVRSFVEEIKQTSEIQSLIFPKDKWTLEEARQWAEDHGFRTDKVDETESSYRFRQHDPENYDEFRTICLTPRDARPGTDECEVEAVLGIVHESAEGETKDIAEPTPQPEDQPEPEPVVSDSGRRLIVRLTATGSGAAFAEFAKAVSELVRSNDGCIEHCRLQIETVGVEVREPDEESKVDKQAEDARVEETKAEEKTTAKLDLSDPNVRRAIAELVARIADRKLSRLGRKS